MKLEEYCSDLKTQAAVERKMLVISEAAVRLGAGRGPVPAASLAGHSRDR